MYRKPAEATPIANFPILTFVPIFTTTLRLRGLEAHRSETSVAD
jgi:hypothetical protein